MTTRTGLIVSPRKLIQRTKRIIDINSLLPCAITRPAQFSLKPYAGVFNPYAKGCSVLCNHPSRNKHPEAGVKTTPSFLPDKNVIDIPDHVPEEFFRRFTDTDSRPLTPTPSCATSARTRNNGISSSHLSARRCVTPEPMRNEQERKQIILDLRRSHSQETLYWNASSEISHPGRQDSTSSSWVQQQVIKHEIEIAGTAEEKEEIEDIQEIEEDELEMALYGEGIINATEDFIDPTLTCINARDDEDDDTLRRRGKLRRKKSKGSMQVITFQPSNEPETHVAQFDDGDQDSPNLSSRQSLVPESVASSAVSKVARKIGDDIVEKDVSHTDDSLKTLRMGLNVEMVECVFDRYRNRLLQEALRTITPDKLGVDSKAVKEMKSFLNLQETDYDKWQNLPRKFSRSSARFELPIDIREMAKLKPFYYLSKYVHVNDDKKQLYHRIFVDYLPKTQTKNEETEHEDFYNNSALRKVYMENLLNSRVMTIDKLSDALFEVLGFHATDENVKEVLDFLELDSMDEHTSINFRTFCGIVSFAERLITKLTQEEDPRDEIEIADFETLLARHFDKIENENMKKMFEIIQK
ncbi:hypothetical protein PVAND_015596 [Polypedilum vanderplanki]|uniref:Uncharacterized protein n=1 Tax=Polypedilum vanderplanki TaxID=319348 RepID=A0A9J6BDK6_POLVA|nr:hypothetical protein PVAND_015596 [Polypedilum vanderplanki]